MVFILVNEKWPNVELVLRDDVSVFQAMSVAQLFLDQDSEELHGPGYWDMWVVIGLYISWQGDV
jgi:hypothetical protein